MKAAPSRSRAHDELGHLQSRMACKLALAGPCFGVKGALRSLGVAIERLRWRHPCMERRSRRLHFTASAHRIAARTLDFASTGALRSRHAEGIGDGERNAALSQGWPY